MIPVDTLDKPDIPEGPSKSQKKRDMTALQVLGQALVDLPADRLLKIEMPDALRIALADARRFTKHEAKRRQMQYIGKLMRTIDPAPFQAVLDAMAGSSAVENARFHRIERLRTQLIEDEAAALAEIAAAHPGADLQHLRQLRRNAVKEQELAKPPRAFREIFRILRELEETATPSEDDQDAAG
jgi:ribosome-associated protein